MGNGGLVSELVGTLSPVNHKGEMKGEKVTSWDQKGTQSK